jgi:hypothetical protein
MNVDFYSRTCIGLEFRIGLWLELSGLFFFVNIRNEGLRKDFLFIFRESSADRI